MKGSKGIAIGIMIVVLVAVSIFSVSHAAQTQPPPTAAPPTVTGKPSQAAPALPDLIVERVWLDKAGSINFQLKNTGQVEIPDREHRQGMVRVTYGKEHEDFSFRKTLKKRPAVDPRGLLKKPGGVVQYNTQIGVKERLTVTVVVDSTKRIAEANEQNNQTTPLMLTPGAIALKGVKEDVAGKMEPKPEPGVLKGVRGKELYPRAMGLRVRAPNGRENLFKGALYHILWEGGEADSDIKIELLRPGRWPILIADSVDSTDGMYPWLIPDSIRADDDYKIKITSTDGSTHDESDGNFSIFDIEERILTVHSPNGGEIWHEGNSYYIHWMSRGIGDKVRVELWDPSRDICVTTINQFAYNYEGSEYHGLPPTTRYNWSVPRNFLRNNGLGLRYGFKIRVCGLSGVDICDESDATFYIAEESLPDFTEVRLHMVEAECGNIAHDLDFNQYLCSGTGIYPAPGDWREPNYSIRGFASFDISDIPRNATIESATLSLVPFSISGNPFGTLGGFRITAVPYGTLSADDYSSPGTSIYFIGDGSPHTLINVAESVQECHRRSWARWQIRMQFEQENNRNGSEDVVRYSPRRSTLEILYSIREP